MRIFKVPFDLKREEKIFGGYLSLRQVILALNRLFFNKRYFLSNSFIAFL